MPDTTYTPPTDRPAEWARMATELAAAGRTCAQIADALCVDEYTVFLLLTAEELAA